MSGLATQLIGLTNLLNLLIHADPGARSGFIASWLTGKLNKVTFDSGAELRPRFRKIHNLKNVNDLKLHQGTKIRVRPKLETIDLHTLLFLRKNIHVQCPDFTKDEYSRETFTKLAQFSKEIFELDQQLDYNLYDIVLDFADTFDTEYMVELYKQVVGLAPSPDMIDILISTNKLNQLQIDKNHACSILKLCLVQEDLLGLKEEHRFWSILDVYDNTPVDQLFDSVLKSIVPANYGILL